GRFPDRALFQLFKDFKPCYRAGGAGLVLVPAGEYLLVKQSHLSFGAYQRIEGISLLEKDTGCAGAGCGFCTKPARRRFCRFCLLLSLISRPPPFSACRTAFPARR